VIFEADPSTCQKKTDNTDNSIDLPAIRDCDSMNLFRLVRLKRPIRGSGGTGFVGSAVAFIAAVCGCTSVGLAIISLLGTAGGLATGFVVNYQLPLRVISVSLLIVAIYSVSRNIAKEFQLPERLTITNSRHQRIAVS